MFSQFSTQVTIWISPVLEFRSRFCWIRPSIVFLGFFFFTWAPGIGRKCRVLISYVMTTLLYFFFLPCDSRREFQNQGERDVAVKKSTWLWIPCEMMAPETTASSLCEKKKMRYESTERRNSPPGANRVGGALIQTRQSSSSSEWSSCSTSLVLYHRQGTDSMRVRAFSFHPSIRPSVSLEEEEEKKKGEKEKKGTRRKDDCWLVDFASLYLAQVRDGVGGEF